MLTVESFAYVKPEGRHKRRYWNCVCDCGNKVAIREDSLGGHTKSCGCYRKERIKEAAKEGKMSHIKYGESRERLHNIWYLMWSRCYDDHSPAYKNYGGRGITICDEWKNGIDGYKSFKLWAIHNGYSKDLSLDRIDNNGDYSPENCRWADLYTQANNKRTNILYEYNGNNLTLAQIARENNINYKALWSRINDYGLTLEQALTKPFRKGSKSRVD